MNEHVRGIRKRGNVYQFNVTVKGKRVTGTAATLEEAAQARANIKAELKIDTPRIKTEADTTDTAQQAMQLTIPAQPIDTRDSLKAIFDITHKESWEGKKGEKTAIMNAKAAMQFFGSYTPASQITRERVREYVIHLEDAGNSNATINRKLSALSLMLKTAFENDYITHLPLMKRRTEYKGRDRYLTEQEEIKMIKVIDTFNNQDFKDFIIVLLDTGCRCGELQQLQKQDVDFETGGCGQVSLYVTKTDKPRTIPMTDRVRAILKRRISTIQDALLFPYRKDWIRRSWNKLRKNMDLEHDKQFIPHMLRHTCASRLVQRGIPVYTVQMWMGHSHQATTARYAHLSPSTLFQAVAVLNRAS